MNSKNHTIPDIYSVRTVDVGTIKIISARETRPLMSSEEDAYREDITTAFRFA